MPEPLLLRGTACLACALVLAHCQPAAPPASCTDARSGWRYYQFRASNPSSSYSGKVDVKALLDWLVSTRGFSTDLWLTRLEVGSELDDNTVGMVTLKDITFEVNGMSSSAQFAP